MSYAPGMGELLLFSIPSLIYLAVLGRRSRLGAAEARKRLGLMVGEASGYGWALVLALPLLALSWLAVELIPSDVVNAPGVVIAQVSGIAAVIGVVGRALGEEILFRGLIGGVLIRRLDFWVGNTAQAVVFLLPHALLLAVDPRIWPILPVQFLAGWLLGWLRHRSGSVLPGALVHAAVNLLVGVLVA